MRRSLLVVLALWGCGLDDAQVLLYVDTDAPVPPSSLQTVASDRPAWLFDRVGFTITRGDDPLAARDFAIDEQAFVEHRVSIGIAPPEHATDVTVLVQLFRADRVRDGAPPQQSTLSALVALPSLSAFEHETRTVTLRVDDVGTMPDAMPAANGAPGPSLVQSWAGATRVPCTIQPAADEVCVPGGAYWFGDPALRLSTNGATTQYDERLVVVSPFLMKQREATVAEFRTIEATLPSIMQPYDRDAAQDPSQLSTWCVYTETPSGLEDLPMNCVQRDAARDYCKSIGGDLPTEAQYELVASGMGAELAYPWGNDDPDCAAAVWGLGKGGGPSSVSQGVDDCLGTLALGGELPAGSGQRDRIALQGGTIVDLAGNLAEWARDNWATLDSPSWAGPGVLTDPLVVVAPGATPDPMTRGGDWTAAPYELRAGYRVDYPSMGLYGNAPFIGFRCVRPAK